MRCNTRKTNQKSVTKTSYQRFDVQRNAKGKVLLGGTLVCLFMLMSFSAVAAENDEHAIFGVRLRIGWKYDDQRMCGATPPGVPHGPDIDVSVFAEVAGFGDTRIDLNLPVFRPIMFAIGAKMIQFEPEATLLFVSGEKGETQLVGGPSLGVSVHYGPDLNSDFNPAERSPSFWALGPRIGGYLGVDFTRPGETFNYQLGLHPYVIPLFSIRDAQNHRGWITGATLDNSFRFQAAP